MRTRRDGTTRPVSALKIGAWLLGASLLVGATMSPLAGCDSSTSSVCTGPQILPHQSPIRFGDLYLRGKNDEEHPESSVATPYEWVLLLQNKCSAPLKIEKVCVVGDAHNGAEGDQAFSLEGPVPTEIPYNQLGSLRITYDTTSVNEDLDQDGKPDPDNVAIVIQSNATDYPTLVIPACARTVSKGTKKEVFECASPVEVPAGTKDASLCQ